MSWEVKSKNFSLYLEACIKRYKSLIEEKKSKDEIRRVLLLEFRANYHSTTNLTESTDKILDEVAPLGGRGGLIAVTTSGEFAMPFQTRLMYRGYWRNGELKVGIGPELE